jgi:hypothetical protein
VSGKDTTVSVASVRSPPDLGVAVASWAVRAALVLVALGTARVQLAAGFSVGLAVILIALAAFRPRTMMAWAFLALTGASLLWQPPEPSWRFAAVLLGVHLTHLLAAWSLHVPARALVQLRVFVRPLARLVAIQVVVQAAALVLLHVAPGTGGGAPWLGILAAAALLALALVLITPIVRERRRRE